MRSFSWVGTVFRLASLLPAVQYAVFVIFLLVFLMASETAQSASTSVEHQEVHLPARVPAPRSVEHAKPASKESAPEWKLLPAVHRHVSPEV